MPDLGERRWRPVDQFLRLLFVPLFLGTFVVLFMDSLSLLLRAGMFATFCIVIWATTRLRPTLFEAPKPRAEVDENRVCTLRGTEILEEIRWSELVRVSIVTTDEGPFLEDFFWLLQAANGSGCVVPNGQACEVDLVGKLLRLPGFNDMAVIEASGCTSGAEFLCWEGRPGEGLAASRNPSSEESAEDVE